MFTTAPVPDYGNMSIDPDAYPRNIRCTLTIMGNGDIILDPDLLPTRINAIDGDKYQLIDSNAGIILNKL